MSPARAGAGTCWEERGGSARARPLPRFPSLQPFLARAGGPPPPPHSRALFPRRRTLHSHRVGFCWEVVGARVESAFAATRPPLSQEGKEERRVGKGGLVLGRLSSRERGGLMRTPAERSKAQTSGWKTVFWFKLPCYFTALRPLGRMWVVAVKRKIVKKQKQRSSSRAFWEVEVATLLGVGFPRGTWMWNLPELAPPSSPDLKPPDPHGGGHTILSYSATVEIPQHLPALKNVNDWTDTMFSSRTMERPMNGSHRHLCQNSVFCISHLNVGLWKMELSKLLCVL